MRNLKHIVIAGQTIYDVALMQYGDVDGALLLLQDNPQLVGYDAVLLGNQILNITSDAIDAAVVAYYKKNNITPATEVDNLQDFALNTGGDFNDDFNGDYN